TWDKATGTLQAQQDPEAGVWRVRHAWHTLGQLEENPPASLGQAVAQLDALLLRRPDEAAERAPSLLAELQRAIWQAYRPVPVSARAVWYRPLEKNAEAVTAVVTTAKAAGIRTIYLETLYHGYPIFPSETFKRWRLVAQYPQYKGWDPLAAYIAAGAAAGVSIVPWVHTLYAGHDSLKPPSPILAAYPAWANRQLATATAKKTPASTVEGGAYFLDPANAEVRRFLTEVVTEITRRYAVPAVQLDDTRYPMPFPETHPDYLGSTWGYTPVARAAFNNGYGVDPVTLHPGTAAWSAWTAFRESQLTALVKDLHDAIKRAKADVKVQVPFATNPTESRVRALQDWGAWSDDHLVDALAVLNYTNSLAAIKRNMRYTYLATAGTVTLIGGVFGPFLAATPTETLAQASAARESGADVIGLFSLQQVNPDLAMALRSGLFAPAGDTLPIAL
ncbi:MAG: family 10 glycosylhydrolase, partial [Candidatus Sericytochromatia bacterium]|nr:family 10 glycosylhydrolase [Candidatus Sericytochromatia bacterium]